MSIIIIAQQFASPHSLPHFIILLFILPLYLHVCHLFVSIRLDLSPAISVSSSNRLKSSGMESLCALQLYLRRRLRSLFALLLFNVTVTLKHFYLNLYESIKKRAKQRNAKCFLMKCSDNIDLELELKLKLNFHFVFRYVFCLFLRRMR